MIRKSKSLRENYLLAGCLFFILFLLVAGYLLVPGLRDHIEKSQQMTALQNHGIVTDGCAIDKDAHEGFRLLPEVIYSFQTHDGTFGGKIGVTDQFFKQLQIGDCFNVMYLPEDPTINSAQTFVEAFNLCEYWSNYLGPIPAVLGFLVLWILLAIFDHFLRRRHYQRQ